MSFNIQDGVHRALTFCLPSMIRKNPSDQVRRKELVRAPDGVWFLTRLQPHMSLAVLHSLGEHEKEKN